MNEKAENRPKRILFVSPNLGAGGAQRQLVNIANGFHEKGYEVSVFLFADRGNLRKSLCENIRIFYAFPQTVVKKSGPFGVFIGIAGLLKTAISWKPDIIYSRQWPKIPAAAIGKVLGVKTVSVEGNNLKHALLLKKRPFLFRMRKMCARTSDRVVANSRGLARETEELFELSRSVDVIYNGVDIEDVLRKAGEEKTHAWLGAGIPVVIAVGAHKKQKGFVHLLEALAVANRTKDVRLIIIGGGNKKELARLAKKFSVEDRTDFLDAMQNHFPFIAKADIFACSSIYEGFSNAILEAMILGKPVISTDHKHGADEIIQDGKNGILVPVGDPTTFANAIVRVAEDKQLRKKLGEEAKKSAENFSRGRMISEYEKLFREI